MMKMHGTNTADESGKMHNRKSIADLMVSRLQSEQPRLAAEYANAAQRYFALDKLLPEELAEAIYNAFPQPREMMLRKSIREKKFVTSQMDRCNPLVEEAVFAFQDPRVVELVSAITGIRQLEPDAQLYAGGVSVMGQSHFLNPHIDNSHDRKRERYRVLNLLYYVSPGWRTEFGGDLELWPDGPTGKALIVPSIFNQLVVMGTTTHSWHSVNEVRVNRARCCVSNYYFSKVSPEQADYFHITSFRGRPGQIVRDVLLRVDSAARMAVRRFAKLGIVETKHYYRPRE